MSTLQFTISIQAPREKVWDVLWNEATYRQWTRVFSEDSYAKSDWKEGSSIQFLDGSGSGMYSVIDTMQPPTKMIFKHLGEIKDGVEKESDWSGALERYTLSGENGTTNLHVEMDMGGDMQGYFEQVFPKALEIVKQLSEQ